MILRRLTKHVKDQNWLAVGIDFAIVVVGVFIGIQVANWNDERVQAARDGVMLERLRSEFEQIVQTGRGLASFIETAPVSTRRLIDILRSSEEPVLDETFRELVSTSLVSAYDPMSSSTYAELVSTGNLSRIGDFRLRDALTAYATGNEIETELSFRYLELLDTGTLERAFRFRTDDTDYSRTFYVEAFDKTGLKDLEGHLQLLLRRQLLRKAWFDVNLRRAESVLTAIDSAAD